MDLMIRVQLQKVCLQKVVTDPDSLTQKQFRQMS